jgi:CheY-like chemotaxis protein
MMRILWVEDDRNFVDGLRPRIEAIGRVQVRVAEGRDEALLILDDTANLFVDLVVLDLKLPVSANNPDVAVDHGEAVFARVQQQAPGVPIVLLTASSVEQFARKLVQKVRQEDVWGADSTMPTIELFMKTDLPEFLEHLKALYARLEVTNAIDITPQEVELSAIERRTIKIFTRKRGGKTCLVSRLSGGLSDSRVLRVQVRDAYGALQIDAAAKLGLLPSVDDESRRFDSHLLRLHPGSYAAKVDTVRFGAVNSGGVFYNLLNGYNRCLFDLLKDKDVATALMPAVRELLAPWRQQVPSAPVQIAQIRRRLLRDGDLADIQRKYGILWVTEIEAKSVQCRTACIHGDLHGGNLLLKGTTDPMLIDFGDVGPGAISIDPVTLELCLFFHPQFAEVGKGWVEGLELDQWPAVDRYAAKHPRAKFISACRGWAHEVAGGTREVLASAYSYLMRQLKYDNTDKDLAMRLLESVKTAVYASFD